MKKLLFIFLGLASFNVHANGCPGQFDPVSGICRFQGNNGEMVQYNMAPPQSSNGGSVQNGSKVVNINVPSKYTAHGRSILKQVSQVAHLIKIRVLPQKKKRLKLANRAGVMRRV